MHNALPAFCQYKNRLSKENVCYQFHSTITITLPEDLAKQANAKGLLSPTAIESYVRGRLQEAGGVEQNSMVPDCIKFDPGLEGLVNPAAFRRGTINGDIVGPFHEVWGDPR